VFDRNRSWNRSYSATSESFSRRVRRVISHVAEPSAARSIRVIVLSGAGWSFAAVADKVGNLHDDTARWRALAALAVRYEARLAEAGLRDPDAARQRAVAEDAWTEPTDLYLVSILDLPGLARRMIERLARAGWPITAMIAAEPDQADRFDALGTVVPEQWSAAKIAIDAADLSVVARPIDQATRTLAELERHNERFTADAITIGVCDPEVVSSLQQQANACDITTHDAAGRPLERTGPYRLLEAVAAYLPEQRFSDFAALVRHPDFAEAIHEALARQDRPHAAEAPDTKTGADRASEPDPARDDPRNADADPARDETAEPDERSEVARGIDHWLTWVDRFYTDHLQGRLTREWLGEGETPRRMKRVLDAAHRDDLLGGLHGERSANQWAEPILQFLSRVYGGRMVDTRRAEDRLFADVCERTVNAAHALSRLPEPLSRRISAAEAIRRLLEVLRGQAVPPEPQRPAVEMLGWLELQLDDAPLMIVTGLNEGFVPGSVTAHPFLPNQLREHLGLLDNARRYARDAAALQQIIRTPRDLHLIAGRTSAAGDPLKPSRLLLADDAEQVAGRLVRFYGDEAQPLLQSATGLRPGGRSDFHLPVEPIITASEPITSLSVTDFRTLLTDPYRFALERIHRLKAVDDAATEMEPMQFGNLLHEVLNGFAGTPLVGSSDADEVANALIELLHERAGARFGRNPLPAVRVQLLQAEHRLRALAGWHAKRMADGWQVRGHEAKVERPDGAALEVDGEPMILTGRIDRIEYHPEQDRWAVLDYKTSEKAEGPEQTHQRGREKRWVDLQLPLYRHLLPAARDADGQAVVTGALDDARIDVGYILLPGDVQQIGLAAAAWSPDDLAEADEAARQVVRLVRANRFEFDPSVGLRNEDPLRFLYGKGALTGAFDDDDTNREEGER